MYLWVILATFITLLYSYNLSVRPDLDRVQSETKAGVVVAKLRTQQNALKDYIASQETVRTGNSYVSYFPGDGINSTTGESLWDEIQSFVPFGHKLPSTSSANPVISKVFCFQNRGDGNGVYGAQNCTDAQEATRSCCTESAGVYVVTFQKIPSRWMNKTTNEPSTDLMGALQRIAGYGRSIGYTMKSDDVDVISGGQRVVSYSEDTTSSATSSTNSNTTSRTLPSPEAAVQEVSTESIEKAVDETAVMPEDVEELEVDSETDSGEIDASESEESTTTETVTYEYREIFPAILNDEDYKKQCGADSDGAKCIIALQEVYS